MSLRDSIIEAAEKAVEKRPKWQVLVEDYREEVETMIELGVPVLQQVKILLDNGVFEKLDVKQYRKIITEHFGYKGRKTPKQRARMAAKRRKFKFEKKEEPRPPARAKVVERKATDDLLSQDVDLLDFQAAAL
ncbi:MAG: hypothetical protein GXO25_07970 [Euryarchaeota archaeon]|nr:hypothetical protein [Euryarchaeota archaeon]